MSRKAPPRPDTFFLTGDGFLFEAPDDRDRMAELITYPLTILCPAATAEPSCYCRNAVEAVAYLRRIDGQAGVALWRRRNLEAWFERGRPFTAMDGSLTERRYQGGEYVGELPSHFH